MEMSGQNIRTLLTMLDKSLPLSLFPRNMIQMNMSGLIPASAHPRVFTDVWPKPSLVYTAIGEPMSKPSLWTSSIFAFPRQDASSKLHPFLSSLRERHGLFGHQRTYIHVPSTLRPAVEQYFEGKAEVDSPEILRDFMVTVVKNKSMGKPPSDPLPEGFRLDRLRSADADFVLDKWSSDYLRDPLIWADRVRLLPSSCIRDNEGRIVAMTLTSPNGSSTHGWTDPQSRSAHLWRISAYPNGVAQADAGMVPFAFLSRKNAASYAAMKAMNMREAEFNVDIICIRPPSSKI